MDAVRPPHSGRRLDPSIVAHALEKREGLVVGEHDHISGADEASGEVEFCGIGFDHSKQKQVASTPEK